MDPLPINQVLQGDCVKVLQSFPDNSIDLVVTDPPYGLNFMGKKWDKALPSKDAFKQILRVIKPGALCFVMSSPRQDLLWRMLQLLENTGFEMNQSFLSWIYKTGFPKAYDLPQGIENINYPLGVGLRNLFDETTARTGEPYTSESREWDGWKSPTGLKPALEPILMVNKPRIESTIVDNVLKHGVGAINIDATRIPFKSENDKEASIWGNQTWNSIDYNFKPEHLKRETKNQLSSEKGRFPTNLLVSDGALDTGEISKSGDLKPNHNLGKDENGYAKTNVYGKYTRIEYDFNGDMGDQSRYFDLDSWATHHGILDVPKPDTSERDYGLKGRKQIPKSKFNLNDGSKDERFDGAKLTPRRNTHPTVKPIKLMSYLIELGCPKDGIVMDPFVGSGTTCIAAKQLCRRYIGIELNPEYHALAEARIAAYPQPLEWFTEAQTE